MNIYPSINPMDSQDYRNDGLGLQNTLSQNKMDKLQINIPDPNDLENLIIDE